MSIDEKNNQIEHPDHYNWIHGIECLDVVEHFGFNLGCVIKYIWRCGRKPGESSIVDLRKAIFYLEREISKIEKSIQENE